MTARQWTQWSDVMQTNLEKLNMATNQCALLLPKPRRKPKQPISIRIDVGTLERFRATGRGWQTLMNGILSSAAQGLAQR
jgi:uncharacterized protein (DUF4415 family)